MTSSVFHWPPGALRPLTRRVLGAYLPGDAGALFSPVSDHQDPAALRNLYRLYVLRNLTILGQTLAIMVAVLGYDFELPLPALGAILACLAGWNLVTRFRLASGRPLGDREVFLQLLVDVGALTGMLYLTGGATNPFTWFLLLPLTIAATVLRRYGTWAMAAITISCYSLLMQLYVPLPGASMHHNHAFGLHVFGMWLGFVVSALLIAYFVVGMAETLRERDRVLAAAREKALRDGRVVALGALAAGAAHELGTPLATMATLTREMQLEYAGKGDAQLEDDLRLLREQIVRCKQALSVISASAGQSQAEAGHVTALADYLPGLVAEWRGLRPEAQARLRIDPSPAVSILAERTLSQALISMLNNAADASPGEVEVRASWTDSQLEVEISDRGAGIASEARASLGNAPYSTKDEGLGLGLFLAHAVVNRLGGHCSLHDREAGGTCARVSLPLDRLLADRRPPQDTSVKT